MPTSLPRSERPKIQGSTLATIIVAVTVIGGALFWASQRTDQSDRAPASSPSSATTVSNEPMDANPNGPEDPSLETSSPVTTTAVNPVSVQLGAFITAFYQLEPADTTDSRRARFEQAGLPVSDELQAQLNFTVYTGSALDQARIEQGLVQSADTSDTISVTDVNGDGRLLYVEAIATVVQTRPDGQVDGQIDVMTGSTWQLQDDWVMTSFNDTYQQPGSQ